MNEEIIELRKTVSQRAQAAKIKLTNDLLVVSVARQRLFHWQQSELLRTYPISTSERPISCLKDSFGTPTGFFAVAEKIGDGQPAGMVFKGRRPVGVCWPSLSSEENAPALITSRILWLTGLQPGHNQGGQVDTRERYIYIHGTNRPNRIGTPQSAGCVLLVDDDMMALFEKIVPGTVVWIGDVPSPQGPSQSSA